MTSCGEFNIGAGRPCARFRDAIDMGEVAHPCPLLDGGRLRIVMLCDWLPPDFGAVGQYAVGFARELAASGHAVTLVGLSSTETIDSTEAFGSGQLTVRKIRRPSYDRSDLLVRAIWTMGANSALLWASRHALCKADEVRFTGSPPYMLHFAMPIAKVLRLKTRYRITDFHPECLIAAVGRRTWWLGLIGSVTNFWRRRVDVIEVLGEDQRRRLEEIGIDTHGIELRRDPSPVRFERGTLAAAPPKPIAERRIVLYSGNWGVAHDYSSFIEGFTRFCRTHPAVAGVWLNATGNRADIVEQELQRRGLPYARTEPVALRELPSILVAADVHLITLDDRFVGYVLPSKVYACVDSGKPVLFVGSEQSDVHLVCSRSLSPNNYRRVNVGDPDSVALALDELLMRGPPGTRTSRS